MYTPTLTASNLSELVENLYQQDLELLAFQRSDNAHAPTVKPTGTIWNRTDATTYGEALYRWNGSAWTLFADPECAQLNAMGTVALAADLPAGGFKLTGLGAGTVAGHSVRFEQVVLVNGANAMAGDLDMGGHEIANLGAPSGPDSAARLVDVEAAGNGLFYQQSNRDQLSNSRPVKVEQSASPSTTWTDVGFVPRWCSLLMDGEFTKQSDNSAVMTLRNTVAEFRRFNADATGGYAGTDGTFVAGSWTDGVETVDLVVTWKYDVGAQGLWIRFVRHSDGAYLNLKKFGDLATDGHLQLQALFGRGM
jgi:hypothetical protein